MADPTWAVSITVTKFEDGYADTEYTDEFYLAFDTFDEADTFERHVLQHGYDLLASGEYMPGHSPAKDR